MRKMFCLFSGFFIDYYVNRKLRGNNAKKGELRSCSKMQVGQKFAILLGL